MATVSTTASLIRQYNAFTGLSAIERSQSGIARAELVYYNVNDSWPATGSGDNRQYQTGNISLPADFGYVLTDARISVRENGSATNNTEAVAQYRLYTGGILGPQLKGFMAAKTGRQNSTATDSITAMNANEFNTMFPSVDAAYGAMVFELENKPTAILYPFGAQAYTSAANPQSVFNFAIGEQVAQQPEYEISMYIRFLQYDIDQSYNYVIQSPQLFR